MYRIKALNHSKALIEYSNDLDNTKKNKGYNPNKKTQNWLFLMI